MLARAPLQLRNSLSTEDYSRGKTGEMQRAHLKPFQHHEVAKVRTRLDALSQGGHSSRVVAQVCLLQAAADTVSQADDKHERPLGTSV